MKRSLGSQVQIPIHCSKFKLRLKQRALSSLADPITRRVFAFTPKASVCVGHSPRVRPPTPPFKHPSDWVIGRVPPKLAQPAYNNWLAAEHRDPAGCGLCGPLVVAPIPPPSAAAAPGRNTIQARRRGQNIARQMAVLGYFRTSHWQGCTDPHVFPGL